MTIAAGQIVDADDLLSPVAYKTTSSDRQSTTTHSDDAHLSVAVLANAVYLGRLVLFANSTVSNSGDLSVRFTFPASAGIAWGWHGATDAITSGVTADLTAPMVEGTTSPSGSLSAGLSSSFSVVAGWVWLQTTSSGGSLTLQWAQASSSANPSRLRAGSHLILERIG
jgi:hypothetical protein